MSGELVNEVTFLGYGIVWDDKAKRELCVFSASQKDARPARPGKFTTSDPSLIEKLKKMGYKIAKKQEDEQ